MNKIRVGVIGVGSLGQHHARVYASLPEVELVGVVDALPERAGEIAARFGTGAYSDYTKLFGKVDAPGAEPIRTGGCGLRATDCPRNRENGHRSDHRGPQPGRSCC